MPKHLRHIPGKNNVYHLPVGKDINCDESMSEAQQSDAMKKLVIFIVALAILGIIIALVWYFAVELPIQQAPLLAPPDIQSSPGLI